jgi:L-alanine-DL-glutamate epimerase-like enolase superfamily enzyme
MKITDLRCAVIGSNPIVRIVTDEGICGHGEIESTKPYLKPVVLTYKPHLLGEDPTNVERVMLKIRRLGAFKPWGSAVSAIEMALWDIAGKAAGLPVYKLLGGKVRDQVRVYNGGVRFPLSGQSPEDYAAGMAKMKAAAEGFTIIKQGIGFHSAMSREVPDFFYGDLRTHGSYQPNRGLLTERGLKHVFACVEAMKSVLGDSVGLALDCGPGFTVPDAIRLARTLEPLNIMWLEDLVGGDYIPYAGAEQFREVTQSTSTPTHTGEQIYLRQNFMELIEKQAVRVIGPDPCDVGGIAELKWVAEYADLHGILVAPHGIFDGVFGLAAHVQLAATLPDNFIAFEYPVARPEWWYDIVDGLPSPIVRNGLIDVWDRPGLGVDFKVEAAQAHLAGEDKDFFA